MMHLMKIDVLADADSVAREAAKIIAEKAREAVSARGRFIMAVSGGRTPWMMLRALSGPPEDKRNQSVRKRRQGNK
jgi:6-phosphogluconolactonase/glucosamine-6-phosphate isomerase/deaminase